MNDDEIAKAEGLKRLGLNELQIEATLDIIRRVPEKLDTKRIQKVIDQINQANQALAKLAEYDVNFVSNANTLLPIGLSLDCEPMKSISSALQSHLDSQVAQVIHEIELTPDSKGTGITRRATTPTSKNYKRYELLTNLWKSWGYKATLYDVNNFMMFLAIAIEGQGTAQKSSNLRKHYSRYYLGIDLEKSNLDLGKTEKMDFEITIKYKAKDSEEPKIVKMGAPLELPVSVDGKKLASEVNANRR